MNPFDELSARDKEVLELILEGKKNLEITEITNCSMSHITSRIKVIKNKLGVETRSELIKLFKK